tara:strand:+ start:4327 stop:5196 length:870 start_codon:yes stop_codon:yes gene_type:complete
MTTILKVLINNTFDPYCKHLKTYFYILNMSLTYPILNDIYAIKIKELNTFISGIDNKLVESSHDVNSKIQDVKSDVSNQNVKIELIHTLFNQYKATFNAGSKLNYNNIDQDYLKSSQHNLINSIKKEYGQIVSSVNANIHHSNSKLIEEVEKKISFVNSNPISKQIVDRIIKIETTISLLSEHVNNDLRSNIHNIGTEFANLNFRLNGLESKYVNLLKKLSSFNCNKVTNTSSPSRFSSDDTHTSNHIMDNNTNTEEDGSASDNEYGNGNNWVKVTKKHKGRHKYAAST